MIYKEEMSQITAIDDPIQPEIMRGGVDNVQRKNEPMKKRKRTNINVAEVVKSTLLEIDDRKKVREKE